MSPGTSTFTILKMNFGLKKKKKYTAGFHTIQGVKSLELCLMSQMVFNSNIVHIV